MKQKNKTKMNIPINLGLIGNITEEEEDREEIEDITRPTSEYNVKTRKIIKWPMRPA